MNTPFPDPTNEDEARKIARHYVGCHLARGYDEAAAKAECHSGFGGPGMPGYTIRTGRIFVPSIAPQWCFSFSELAMEIHCGGEQLTLF